MIIIYEYLNNDSLERVRYAVIRRALEDIQRGYKLENTSVLIESLLIWGWNTDTTTVLIKECFLRRWKKTIKKLIKEVERLKVNLEDFYNELIEVDKELNKANVSRETKSKVDEIEEQLTEETSADETNVDETNAEETNGENEKYLIKRRIKNYGYNNYFKPYELCR